MKKEATSHVVTYSFQLTLSLSLFLVFTFALVGFPWGTGRCECMTGMSDRLILGLAFTSGVTSVHDDLRNVVARHRENTRWSRHKKQRSWHIDMGRLGCRRVTYGHGLLSCLASFIGKKHEDR